MDSTRASIDPFARRPGAVPFVVARSEGAWLFTPDGRRILDAAGGAILVSVGHGRREVVEAYAHAAAEATYLVPPFIVGEFEIDRMAEVVEASIASAVARGGLMFRGCEAASRV